MSVGGGNGALTRLEVAQLVAVLADAYPRAPVSVETVKVYESLLADLEFEVTQQAVARLIATSKWFPTIAEIRAAVVEIRCGPRRSGVEAWGDVVKAIRFLGAYRLPTFDDPLVAECVRTAGWVNLCRSDNDAADRARFIELYEALREREHLDQVAGRKLTLRIGGGALRGGLRPAGEILAGLPVVSDASPQKGHEND